MISKPRILLQVDKLASYRVPIFNLLAEKVELHVASSGELGNITNTCFNRIKGKAINFGPFIYNHYQIRLFEYDLIITSFDGYNINSYWYSLLYPRKTVLYCLGYGKSLFAALIRRYFHRRTVATIVYTQATAQQLIKSGVTGEKVFYTGNTVRVGTVDSKQRNTFINIGTPKARKKVEDVIKAFASVKNKLPSNIRLILAGPEAESAYGADVKRYGLTNKVVFYGEVRNETEIAELYSQAIAFISGHIGLSAPQSLGHGVPIVARADLEQGPEFECLIEGYTGYTYRSIDELSCIMLDLASNTGKVERMGHNALLLYKSNLTEIAMCKRILRAIKYALAQKKVRNGISLEL